MGKTDVLQERLQHVNAQDISKLTANATIIYIFILTVHHMSAVTGEVTHAVSLLALINPLCCTAPNSGQTSSW